MASSFECEVRYKIDNIEEFEKKLINLGGRISFPYEFTDYYFKPTNEQWNPIEQNLRIRDWQEPKNPTTIYFVKNEILSHGKIKFKRAVYPNGKVSLFSGELSICKSLLEDLGFKEWFHIKKEKAKVWELSGQGFETAVEYIDGVGWTGELEFEGEDIEKAKASIKKAADFLSIPEEHLNYKTISAIYAEKTGIL